MVLTRSHDHPAQNVNTNDPRGHTSSENNSKKRKFGQDGDHVVIRDTKSPVTKETAVAVVINQPCQDSRTAIIPEKSRGFTKGRPNSPTDTPVTVSLDADRPADVVREQRNKEQSTSQPVRHLPQRSGPETRATEEKYDPQTQPATSSERVISVGSKAFNQGGEPSTEQQETSTSNNAQEDDKASDDEAPEEAVTTATQDKIGAAAAKATEQSMKEEAAKKIRRREHNDRMRLQANTVKADTKRRKPGLQQSITDSAKDGAGDIPLEKGQKRPPLPVILPDEILNAESSALPLATPPIVAQPQKAARRKLLLERQDRPPKDLMHGNTKIRVLQHERTRLPPKSSMKGKDIREKWLLGRRGDKSGLWIPRRKQLSGFVRSAI